MFALLPFLALVLLWDSVRRTLRFDDWRLSLVVAAVFWGVLIVGITESLSAVKQFNGLILLIVWAMIIGILAARRYMAIRADRNSHGESILNGLSFRQLVILAPVALICLITLLIALVAPPNYVDVLAYHVGRIPFWLQQQSVAFYPTGILRQLHSNPFSSFALANLQALNNGDYAANLLSWAAFVGCIIVGSFIVRQLGGAGVAQRFAGLLIATVPMAILQASSAENDLVVAFWCLCCAAAALQLRASLQSEPPLTSKRLLGWALLLGGSFGLAALTKATGIVFAAPFVAYASILLLARSRLRAVAPLAAAALLAMSLNVPHMARNLSLYGGPFGPGAETAHGVTFRYTNAIFGIQPLLSNLTKNTALEIALPSKTANNLIERGVSGIHTVIGWNIRDARTNITSIGVALNDSEYLSEAIAPNALHSLLLIVGIVLFPFVWRRLPRGVATYCLVILSGYLLYCEIVTFQPSATRLHLPVFVLMMPALAIIFSNVFSGVSAIRLRNAIGIVVFVGAMPFLLMNQLRPIIGAQNIFNTSRLKMLLWWDRKPTTSADFYDSDDAFCTQLAQRITQQGCRQIGIYANETGAVYPLWAYLTAQAPKGQWVTLHFIGVDNVSAALDYPKSESQSEALQPCAIIAMTSLTADPVSTLTTHQKQFRAAMVNETTSHDMWAQSSFIRVTLLLPDSSP